MIKYLLNSLIFIIFVQQNCIVLNVYNGNILNIGVNLEYMLWYFLYLIPIFFISCYKYTLLYFIENILEIGLCLKGICYNIYWHYAWQLEGPDKRHRTEYYDTQTLLCSMFFVLLIKKIDYKINDYEINYKLNYKLNKTKNILHNNISEESMINLNINNDSSGSNISII